MSAKQGHFITFEGGEGSGKTTQINKLADHLKQSGHKVLTTREPGGTKEGEKIRALLVQRDGGKWTPMAECLLFSAAREMLLDQIVKPALEEGTIVLCDRFSDSTLAYQGYGHGLNINMIQSLNRTITGDTQPDLTFILDIDPEIGLKRALRRQTSDQYGVEQLEDRFENLDKSFHEKLRAGFIDIAEKDPKRCHVIDANQDVEIISEAIIARAEDIIGDAP